MKSQPRHARSPLGAWLSALLALAPLAAFFYAVETTGIGLAS